jgi:hypothetical protein
MALNPLGPNGPRNAGHERIDVDRFAERRVIYLDGRPAEPGGSGRNGFAGMGEHEAGSRNQTTLR